MNKNLIDSIEWKLNDIKRIADFQIDRIKDEKSVNKNLVLGKALEIIELRCQEILEELVVE